MIEGYKEAERRIQVVKEYRHKTLDLSSLELATLPNDLKGLTHIKALNISSNKISNIGSLERLESLEQLHAYDNRISRIDLLGDLPNLITLNLHHNDISNIGVLGGFTQLENLNLSYNKISRISALGKLVDLKKLNVGDNFISDISVLRKSKNLEVLSLQNNQIRDVNHLANLKSLTDLNLDGNQISNMAFVRNLINLTRLSLGYNKVGTVDFLDNLINLEYLVLNSNQISCINDLKSLIRLKKLDLSDNEISDVSSLNELLAVKWLNLRDNEISEVSPLVKLTSLETLDLSSNHISSIVDLLPLFEEGRNCYLEDTNSGIVLVNNPIQNPPLSVVSQGGAAVLNWFEQLEDQGEEPLFESKLMILGQGGAGKTTFAKLQIDEEYSVDQVSEDSTLGIEIHKGKIFEYLDEMKSVKAHLWDFGGQNIQKMLHQFFITEDCLYLLVSDRRKENTNFDYWFQIINLLGPNCPVIVLENDMQVKGNNEHFALNKYRSLYPKLDIQLREIDLKEVRGREREDWGALNKLIAQKMCGLEIVNRPVPKKWSKVRDKLNRHRRKRYLTLKEFYEICESTNIGLAEEQAELCLKYLKSLGDLVHFDDSELRNFVFLDHQWLTEGLYYILADDDIADQNGLFTRGQAYKKWGGTNFLSRKYKRHEREMLLLLLLKDQFDLCYELPEKDVFITPLLLPNDRPGEWLYETNLHFQYNYGFMPHGLFSRAIVRIHEKIEGEQLWRTGVRLYNKETGTRAEVQQFNDPDDNRQVIDVKINGDQAGCKDMLEFIRTNVEPLHKEFKNLRVKEMVGCNCSKCKGRMAAGKKPMFYDFSKLLRSLQNGRYHVDCDYEFKEPIKIGQILSDVVAEDAASKRKYTDLYDSLKELGVGFTQNISEAKVDMSGARIGGEAIAKSKVDVEVVVNVKVEIQNLLGDTEVLKEDIERELKIKKVPEEEIQLAVSDVELAEKALAEMGAAESIDQIKPRSKSRLRRFMDSLSKPDSTMHKTLIKLREGRDHGVRLAETYNKIAGNFGMPLVPPAALEVIKSI